MTREEAIVELSVIWERLSHPEDCENGCYSFRDGNYLEAIDMAISVLEKPNYETDTEVRLVVTDRHKDKVVLCDVFGEVEYLPSEPSLTIQTGQTWGKSANIGKPSDLISRADAIEAIIEMQDGSGQSYNFVSEAVDILNALPSAETHEIRTETHGVCLISKSDAIEVVCRTRCGDKAKGCPAHSCPVIEEFDALPSADRPTVAYVCDGRACEADCSECFRTTNIEHAKHFERLGDTYMEQADRPTICCWACKRFMPECTTDADTGMCDAHGQIMRESDFCSWAERKNK